MRNLENMFYTEEPQTTTSESKWDIEVDNKIIKILWNASSIFSYVKTRTFWLVNGEMDVHKLLSRKNKSRSQRASLKKNYVVPPESS